MADLSGSTGAEGGLHFKIAFDMKGIYDHAEVLMLIIGVELTLLFYYMIQRGQLALSTLAWPNRLQQFERFARELSVYPNVAK